MSREARQAGRTVMLPSRENGRVSSLPPDCPHALFVSGAGQAFSSERDVQNA